MAVLHVSGDLQLQLLGSVAQVLLLPGQRLHTFADNVLCCSGGVEMTRNDRWIVPKNAALKPIAIAATAQNLDYVSLGRPMGGPILAVRPQTMDEEVVVCESDVLAVFELTAERFQ